MKQDWRRAYLACALLVLAFHFRLALPGRALVANDFRALFIPLRQGLQRCVFAGEWPFWQRGIFLGYPMLGDIQFQLFNPLTWLTLPLDAARGLTVQTLCELCLCATGMAYWMKQRGLRAAEGVFAGVAFALCLKQTVHLHHWTFAASTCAWPWMMAGADGFKASGRARFLVLSAVAACGSWIGSSPQMAWFGCGLCFVYCLYLSAGMPWRQAVPALLAVPLGVLLAAPLLLPVAELSALGPRGPGITYNFAASWSWPWRSVWAAMLLPRAWGGRPEFRGPMNYWEVQGYFGLLPMALLFAAPFRRVRNLYILSAVAALGVWISWGDSSFLGLHRWAVRLLPGYGGFRNPTRALMLSMFCVSALAAEGLAALRDNPALRTRALLASAALLIGVASFTLSGAYWREAIRADAAWAALLLALGAAWLWKARPSARWALCAVPLYLVDVAVQTWDAPEIGRAAAEGHALEGLQSYVPAAPQPRRVATLLDWGENNNATYARGWEGVTGYGPTPILRVLTLLDATVSGAIHAPRPLDDDQNFPRLRTDSPLTPLFGAPLVLSNRDASVPPLARAAEVRLYRMPALPRVFWTSAWQAAPDEQAGPLLPAAARGDLAVLSDTPVELPQSSPGPPVPGKNVQIFQGALEADLTAPAAGLAVVLEPWFPGWTALVDGQPAPILRADYAFMAVPMKPGAHHLKLSYFPSRLLPGLLLSLLAALALVALKTLLPPRVDSPPPGGYFPPP